MILGSYPPSMPAQPTYRYDVYISYNEAEAAWVFDWLLPRLRRAGLEVAVDVESFSPGAPVLEESERVIAESRTILALLSPAYVAEGWDNFETLLVQSADPGARFRRLIPLLVAPCEPPGRLALLNWVDFTDPEEWEPQLDRVINAARGLTRLPELRYDRIPDARQRWWELRSVATIGLVSLLTLALVTWQVWNGRGDPPPSRMPEGTFNIGIARFSAVDTAGAPIETGEGRERAISAVNYLRSQQEVLAGALDQDVEIWGPAEGIPAITATEVAAKALTLNADVLVYGTLHELAPDQWRLAPHFYLNEETARRAAEGAELQGPFALGNPIAYQSSGFIEGEVNVALTARLEALVHLIRGLIYLSQQSAAGFEQAGSAFIAATNTTWGRGRDQGQEILYHFLGTAYAQQAEYAEINGIPTEVRRAMLDDAVAAYEQALDLNTNYVRAGNGLGGAYRQLAYLPVSESGEPCAWDWDRLAQAEAQFREVRQADAIYKTEAGDADFNAGFALARIHFTRAFCQQADSWTEARNAYQAVVDAYEAEPLEQRRRAMVLAYRELGQAYFYDPASGSPAAGDPLLAQVIDLYRKSVELAETIDTERSLLLAQDSMVFLLFALCRAGRDEEAKTTLDDFVLELPDAQRVRARIVDLAALPEECQ